MLKWMADKAASILAWLILALVLAFVATYANAQGGPSTSNYPATASSASGAPSPTTCGGVNQFYLNTANGNFYTCPSGTYVLAGNSSDPAAGSGIDSGTSTAYVVTGGPITSLTPTGTIECFLPTNANSSTTPTVAFNGLTAKTIIKYNNLAVAINDMITTQTACVVYNGTSFYLLNPQGSTGSGKIMLQASPVVTGTFTSPLWASSTNCAAVGTAANPSVAACTAAPAGAFSCATAASGTTCQVNTTAVTANSVIIVQQVVSEGTRLSVTCNTASVLPATPLLLSKSAGASFTLTMGTITTNPGCFDYWIIN